MTAFPLLFYCDQHDIPLPEGHKFPMEKYRLLRQTLEAAGGFRFAPGPLAQPEDLLRVHEPGYVDAFLNNALSDAQIRRIGFPRHAKLVERTLSSVGATVAASDVALDEGWSGVLAGGTHHAFAAEGAGFCVLNDVAVAIARLLHQGRIQRPAIIDLDVHQGDGTAVIFQNEPRVLTFSAHGRNNFPFRKQKSDIDLEFENGTTDEVYLAAVEATLPRVWAFEPDMVFYQAGVDALASDRLGKLAMTQEGIMRRNELVYQQIAARKLPCVVNLGGGYASPIEDTVSAAAQTYLQARSLLEHNAQNRSK